MYFNVYSDAGATIEGYLIPDGFSAKPSITVTTEGQHFGPFPCDVFLAGPYTHKHHETGIVGFLLDGSKVPDLEAAVDLQIADANTGFIFYRRFKPGQHILKRVFRLETQLAPHREFDQSLRGSFQFHASGVERYGSETVRQMLEIANQQSTYVSGRVMLKSVQQYFTNDTIKITSVRDPFYELAIRISSIAAAKRRSLSFLSERDSILFGPAIDHFDDVNVSDPERITNRIRSAPKDVLSLFESPFTQQLVALSPTEKASRDAVSSALDALSQFTVFNPDETDARLALDTAEALDLPSTFIAFSPLREKFVEISKTLRTIGILEQVLENDLILHHFIHKAAIRASSR